MAVDPETVSARDKLLHVADLHFWHITKNPLRLLNKRILGNYNVWLKRQHQFVMHRAAPFVDALADAGPKNILFTGDFSSTSLDEEFSLAREFVDTVHARGFAIQLMPGNHDVYTFEAVRKQRFESYFSPYVPKNGYPAHSTLPGGTSVVLVQTACANRISSRGRITNVHVECARDLLAGASDPVIVAGHYPLLQSTSAYVMTRERGLRGGESLRQMLGNSGKTVLYIAGHVHRFSYVCDPQYPNLSHLCTGTFFGHNKHERIDGEFSEIDVVPQGFLINRHTFDGSWRKSPAQFCALHANRGPDVVA